ncbi:hypothetical protein WAI453_001005 [Rhynchosporium graminicola]|uniref:Related to KRI1 KRRI-Interacting protein 1 n=1 Tax=Rhynchosporium graminicola TaxID=2792576 RepID=A0A1E1K6B3_9HELO|nr:related to KRI1 KRRI-Interacting protein 1 [Rhynchosporium commune]
MAKRKADSLSQTQASESSSSKKLKANVPAVEKKSNLLEDSDSGSTSDPETEGGVKVEEPDFRINKEYAIRFEHNKKREELQRLEEKFASDTRKAKGQYGDKYDEESESSDDEEEDDEGILATEELDAQISDALNAIRSKDPRVYNTEATFYRSIEENSGDEEAIKVAEPKRQKPMYLTDYHRENLLRGHTGADEEDEAAPRTFVQEQEDLKKTILKEMHAAADGSDSEASEDGGFLIPKTKPAASNQGATHPSRLAKVKVNLDISSADKNPDTFLSNFMAARAWVPGDEARFQPLESDDEEEDDRADRFEEAYNMRFEESKGSNEVLKSYARDVIAAKSVRREDPSGRKKQRDTLRDKIEASKKEREEERAQLRRLKIEEAEEKLKKIKRAAGLRGRTLKGEEWADFLDDGWDDKKWESEMNQRFGEDYYAEVETKSDSDNDDEAKSRKKKVKKPKWDDEIDIGDLVPEFEEGDSKQPDFTLSDSEFSDDEDDTAPRESKSKQDRKQGKQSEKKVARLERKQLEDLVDSKMDLDLPTKSKQPTVFRYRETSPTSFGLTARDILMAPDASLNEFAGLKKMATFRDAEKKRKDKKKLGKKARLRQWRKETFGNEDGPEIVLKTDQPKAKLGDEMDIVEGGRKKKKRSRKNKGILQPE